MKKNSKKIDIILLLDFTLFFSVAYTMLLIKEKYRKHYEIHKDIMSNPLSSKEKLFPDSFKENNDIFSNPIQLNKTNSFTDPIKMKNYLQAIKEKKMKKKIEQLIKTKILMNFYQDME